jgi:hypothetical protein
LSAHSVVLLTEGASFGASVVAILIFFKPLTKVPGRVRARLMPNHSVLRGSAYQHDLGGRGPCPYVNVSLAPSRCFLGRAARRVLDPTNIHAWFIKVFGTMPEPEYRNPVELVRYQYGSMNGDSWLWVHRRGLVDISVPVQVQTTGGDIFLPLENLVMPVMAIAQSVQDGWYERVYGRPRLGRRRLDWCISVGAGVLDAKGFQVPLSGFTFPGRAPGPKPAGMRVNGAPSGETLRAMWTLSTRTDRSDIVHVAVGGLLTGSGYVDVGPSIDDAIGIAATPVGQAIVLPVREP